MTRRGLIKAATQAGLTVRKADKVVTAILNEIKAALEAGESVKLTAVGTLEPYRKKARKGNSFGHSTSQTVDIPAKWVIRFKGYGELLETLEKNKRK